MKNLWLHISLALLGAGVAVFEWNLTGNANATFGAGISILFTYLVYRYLGDWFKPSNSKIAGKEGYYFNYLKFNFIFRPVICLALGMLVSLLIFIMFTAMEAFTSLNNPITFKFAIMIGLLLSALFSIPTDNDELTVPETAFAAQLMWFGIPLPVYLTTSEYTWIGRTLGFSISKRVLDSFTDENGFIKTGEVQFSVWNEPGAKPGSRDRDYISAPTKNEAEIKASILLVIEYLDPMKVLRSDNPALDLGNRARQEFRELCNKFVDTDIPKLHSELEPLLMGKLVVTSFISKTIKGHKVGSMICNRAGDPLFTHQEENESEEQTIVRFVKTMQKEADEEMLANVKSGSGTNSTYDIAPIKLSKPIGDLLDELGYVLKRVTFADIEFADEVQKAANEASAEQNQAKTQLQSAETISQARRLLMPNKDEINNPGFELAQVIAAAQDNKNGNIRVIMVPGGNSLTSAAIAGASQIGERK